MSDEEDDLPPIRQADAMGARDALYIAAVLYLVSVVAVLAFVFGAAR